MKNDMNYKQFLEEEEKLFDEKFDYLPPKDSQPLYMVSEKAIDKDLLSKLADEHVEIANIGEIKRIDNNDVREELKIFLLQRDIRLLQLIEESVPAARTREYFRLKGSDYLEGDHDGWNDCREEILNRLSIFRSNE